MGEQKLCGLGKGHFEGFWASSGINRRALNMTAPAIQRALTRLSGALHSYIAFGDVVCVVAVLEEKAGRGGEKGTSGERRI